MPSNYHYLTRAKSASRYDAYSWDNMLLVEQALVAVEEDGQSDLDEISTNSEGRQCSVLR